MAGAHAASDPLAAIRPSPDRRLQTPLTPNGVRRANAIGPSNRGPFIARTRVCKQIDALLATKPGAQIFVATDQQTTLDYSVGVVWASRRHREGASAFPRPLRTAEGFHY